MIAWLKLQPCLHAAAVMTQHYVQDAKSAIVDESLGCVQANLLAYGALAAAGGVASVNQFGQSTSAFYQPAMIFPKASCGVVALKKPPGM